METENWPLPVPEGVIEVRDVWKGIKDKRVTLHTGIGGGDCGVDFEVGKAYLVFAAAGEGPSHPLSREKAWVIGQAAERM